MSSLAKSMVKISPQLQKVIGLTEASRAQVPKSLWAYIKEHDLQVPSDRRKVTCDPKLKEVFGKDEVHMLEIPGLIKHHLTKKVCVNLSAL
ncbi:unnamed protein product [Chrysoparadoxa australica]